MLLVNTTDKYSYFSESVMLVFLLDLEKKPQY
jgi:hypothetical protein